MAVGSKKKHPGRVLLALALIIVVMAGSLAFGVMKKKTSPAPALALDLSGGTQLILAPRPNTEAGAKGSVSAEDVAQAIEVIRQRVDASGVSEAEITSQGNENILVSLPGNPSEETLDLVRQSAELNFRSVIGVLAPQSAAAIDKAKALQTNPKADVKAFADPKAYAATKADLNKDGKISDTPAKKPTDNSSDDWITEAVMRDAYALDCTKKNAREGAGAANPKKPLVTCSRRGNEKYVLSPVDLPGANITGASANTEQVQGGTTGRWEVNLRLNSKGAKLFADTSRRLFGFREQQVAPGQLNPKNRFAIVLDGIVVSAPGIESVITNGDARITGDFTRTQATTLANQLQFGSLPLNFEVQQESKLSATLGADQLRWGVIAGIIGLALIVVFLILQYRGLSLVAVSSLVIAGVIAYLTISLLSWSMGYRLSLAGIAGIIISIGTTADSFIVYFERIRDEIREGRPLSSAVQQGWLPARRTILTADAVNLLAALVLYFLAVGGVQGFAFTLGVMTVIDLAVIFWFTHPTMVLLMRTKFFGRGHRLSGLDPEHLGAKRVGMSYQGRGRFKPVKSAYTQAGGAATEAGSADKEVAR